MYKVSVTDFRKNISHYIALSASEDVHVTKNGEVVAVLISPDKEYYQKLINLYGCLKEYDTGEDYDAVIGERIMRK